VALVRISDAGLKRAARGWLKIQEAKKSPKKSPSGHHRTTLSGNIFATKARIDSRKQEGQHPLTGQRAPPISGGT